jgi:hypothetical protein
MYTASMIEHTNPATPLSSSVDPRRELMHRAREQEAALIFDRTPAHAFDECLELGAGDCYQSRYLKRYVRSLTCTDFDETLLSRTDPEVSYLQCDAEQVDRVFAGQRFDLVFSSNMLTHTPDKDSALRGITKILEDEGLFICIVPSPSWKMFKLAAFYPRLLVSLPARVAAKFRSAFRRSNGTALKCGKSGTNNPKVSQRYSRLRQLTFPVPIGAYPSNSAELFGARRSAWIPKFRDAGMEVFNMRRGPFICGDFNRPLNDLFARLGFSTETIYIAKKIGRTSRFEKYFV